MVWQNEDQVAAEVVGFLQQFLEVFKELQGKKLYVTGESVSKLPHVPESTLIAELVRRVVCSV